MDCREIESEAMEMHLQEPAIRQSPEAGTSIYEKGLLIWGVTCRSFPFLLFTCNGGNSTEILSWTLQADANNSKLITFLES
jgi:hypothetical protein